ADMAEAVGMSAVEVVPVIASLLSLPLAPPYQATQVSAKIQRDLTMRFLLEWLTRQSADRPTVLVVEDLHWADPSSLELVRMLFDQIHRIKVLLLLTFRPDFHPPWHLYSFVAHLPLNRLTADEVQQMIGHISKGRQLPDFVRARLVEKTDGVPLF